MDHLSARIGLLMVVRHGDRVKLAHAAHAVEHARGIFPRHRAARFNLRPADLAASALAQPALGDEIVDPANPVLIAGIPILHGRIFDFSIIHRDQFNDRCVKLVFIAHGRSAALQIGDMAASLGNNQGPLKLASVFGIDAEIGRQFHRATNAFGDVDKSAVRKDCRVERRKIIVAHGHNLAEPLFHKLWVFLDRL